MTPNEFQQAALRTAPSATQNEKSQYLLYQSRQILDLLHAGIGMCTETGEFQDALKKHIFYGQPLDILNLKEELSDVMWYVALGAEAAGTSIENLMIGVINKLKARYPDSFSEEYAAKRLDKQ